MEVRGKVHCFFEQSGTFKNEFVKLGIPAEDYDIQNYYGRTDHVVDLFQEIEKAYNYEKSIFDQITGDDLVMAFFPCIYFETIQQTYFSLEHNNLKGCNIREKVDIVLERLANRTHFHALLYKLYCICCERGIRTIIENPANFGYLIAGQNFPPPTLIDRNRLMMGDYYKKPTAYWFVACIPTYGIMIEQKDKEERIITKAKKSDVPGMCSRERSEISPDYARNFILCYILGRPQGGGQMSLFK